MATQFKCNVPTFKYKKTRNGVAATCQILDAEGNLAATLHDDPAAIVAQVIFQGPTFARKFLEEAKLNLAADSWVHAAKNQTPAAWASEYARQFTMAAETEWAKANGVK